MAASGPVGNDEIGNESNMKLTGGNGSLNGNYENAELAINSNGNSALQDPERHGVLILCGGNLGSCAI